VRGDCGLSSEDLRTKIANLWQIEIDELYIGDSPKRSGGGRVVTLTPISDIITGGCHRAAKVLSAAGACGGRKDYARILEARFRLSKVEICRPSLSQT
jgi:hypothetical protein